MPMKLCAMTGAAAKVKPSTKPVAEQIDVVAVAANLRLAILCTIGTLICADLVRPIHVIQTAEMAVQPAAAGEIMVVVMVAVGHVALRKAIRRRPGTLNDVHPVAPTNAIMTV